MLLETPATEGYIYTSWGDVKYLKHVVSSVVSLRRYDRKRPVALVCTEQQMMLLQEQQLEGLFDRILPIEKKHASITGFKHNLYKYMPFDRNLFLDSDIIWCRSPDPLWVSLSPYPFTITGVQRADNFFGAPKNIGVLRDILLRRRERTLRRFGLTYLSRVQSGMIYASDIKLTSRVCKLASDYLKKIDQTHFQSRLRESGRDEESCEWSLAMAMSRLNVPVYPWHLAHESPQLDYIEEYVEHDPDFEEVSCTYYSDPFVYNLRGLKQRWFRRILMAFAGLAPGKLDQMKVTPYCLHFGWLHQKQPFQEFSERTWKRLTAEKVTDLREVASL